MKLYEQYHSKRKLQRCVIDNNNFVYRALIYFLRKYLKNNSKLLDIGCGVGTVDFYLAKQGQNVVGIDISQNSISIARKNVVNFDLGKNISFKVLDFPNKVPKERFDIVICSEVLEHLKHDKIAVKKIKCLLDDYGILIASSPSKNAPLFRWGFLDKFEREVGHLRRYSEESFRKLFEGEGFKILEIKKTEGILRNLLFTNPIGGFLLKILKRRPFSDVISFLDDLLIPIFGESNIYLVAQKY